MNGIKNILSKVFLIALMLCVLNGCANEFSPIGTTHQEGSQNRYIIQKEEDGFFSYTIFATNGEVIIEGTTWKEPYVTAINEQLVCFVFYEGPSESSNWGIFCDYSNGRVSEVFRWVLDFSDKLVVLGQPNKLVVRNIFDDLYYEEVSAFPAPVAQVSDGILSAKLADDDRAVEVQYVTDGTYQIRTDTIVIAQPKEYQQGS